MALKTYTLIYIVLFCLSSNLVSGISMSPTNLYFANLKRVGNDSFKLHQLLECQKWLESVDLSNIIKVDSFQEKGVSAKYSTLILNTIDQKDLNFGLMWKNYKRNFNELNQVSIYEKMIHVFALIFDIDRKEIKILIRACLKNKV